MAVRSLRRAGWLYKTQGGRLAARSLWRAGWLAVSSFSTRAQGLLAVRHRAEGWLLVFSGGFDGSKPQGGGLAVSSISPEGWLAGCVSSISSWAEGWLVAMDGVHVCTYIGYKRSHHSYLIG